MCRSILSLSKMAHQMCCDHLFSQRNRTAERKVGAGVVMEVITPLPIMSRDFKNFQFPYYNPSPPPPLPLIPGFPPFLVEISHSPLPLLQPFLKNLEGRGWDNGISRPYPFKFFKGCLPQILLGP